MSAAVAEPIVVQEHKVAEQKVEQQKQLVIATPKTAVEAESTFADHPLFPVVVAAILALFGSALFVGSILFWLAVRHSGVVAP